MKLVLWYEKCYRNGLLDRVFRISNFFVACKSNYRLYAFSLVSSRSDIFCSRLSVWLLIHCLVLSLWLNFPIPIHRLKSILMHTSAINLISKEIWYDVCFKCLDCFCFQRQTYRISYHVAYNSKIMFILLLFFLWRYFDISWFNWLWVEFPITQRFSISTIDDFGTWSSTHQ